MKIKETSIKEGGDCNFCNKGELSIGRTNILYPYDKVYTVQGNYVLVTFCEDCLKELEQIQ